MLVCTNSLLAVRYLICSNLEEVLRARFRNSWIADGPYRSIFLFQNVSLIQGILFLSSQCTIVWQLCEKRCSTSSIYRFHWRNTHLSLQMPSRKPSLAHIASHMCLLWFGRQNLLVLLQLSLIECIIGRDWIIQVHTKKWLTHHHRLHLNHAAVSLERPVDI
jgi:hypothetical protein